MANTKPFVQAACICEKALLENDGVPSIIRMVDVFGIDLAQPVAVLKLNLFVSVKSGDLKGDSEIKLFMRQPPEGKSSEIYKWGIALLGAGHGCLLRMEFGIPKPRYGMYWFDVIWSGEVLTSIPLQLIPPKAAQDTPPPKQ